jgi:hypothetical protein
MNFEFDVGKCEEGATWNAHVLLGKYTFAKNIRT